MVTERCRPMCKQRGRQQRVAQRTNTTSGQAEILAKLDITEPGRFLDFELPTPSA